MASAFKPKPKRAKKPSRIDRHCFEEIVLAQISDVQAEEFIKESSDLMSKATWAMSEIKTQLTALTAVSTAAPFHTDYTSSFTSSFTLTTQAIFDLVGHLKEQGIQNVHVLGILKRSCKADPNKTRSQMSGTSNPPLRRRDACKPGENDSIRLVNDALRQNEEVHRYKFVGVGDLCSRSFYKPDGVHLNSTGVSRLAKILRKSCL